MSLTSRVASLALARCKNSSIGCNRLYNTNTLIITNKNQLQQQLQQFQVRYMGGGGHMPVPQSSLAEFPASPTGASWEPMIHIFYTLTFFGTVYCVYFGDNDDCSAWAQTEARTRLKLKEQGFTNFQFGVHYQDLNSLEIRELILSSQQSTTDNDDEAADDE